MNVLLTGSTGFIGRALANKIEARPHLNLTIALRRPVDDTLSTRFVVGDISSKTDWSLALINQQVVIHAAARVHVMSESASDPLAEFRAVNVGGTLNLARQAAKAGVKRFIFISSIKVNGEGGGKVRPYNADDVPKPYDAYGISKAEAEIGLKKVAEETGLEVVIIRPPLVYGPGVKGNFDSMIRWVAKGLPLPFGSVTNNRRSLVGIDNLVDLILVCLAHQNAANQIFLVSDGENLSLAELLYRIGEALKQPVRLFPVPVVLLKFLARLVFKRAVAERLFGSLQVDIAKTTALLGWKPLVSVEEGLRRTVGQRL